MRFFPHKSRLAFLSAGLFLAAAACRPGETPPPPAPPFPEARDLNVVIVLIDALRADHLPFYGYSRNTAPFLASLAAEAVVFERAVAASSTTAPATASLFTGLHPSEHGVITGFLAHRKHQDQSLTLNRIPAELTTMGEMFRAFGYRTFCLSDNLNISAEMGFDPGFEKFHTMRNRTAEEMNRLLREWQPEITAGGKYFLYLHYMDPHAPYLRRAPWFQGGGTPQQQLVSAYDSEIHFVDQKLREMFELFGWRDNALVVVLADHGEELGDHGQVGHGKNLYRESIHVPFFFLHPAWRAGRRVSAEVATLELMPTLASLTGLPADPIWRGRSLKPLMDGGSLPRRPLVAELLRLPSHPKGSFRSVLTGNWHLIQRQARAGPPEYELFDWDRDWAEKNNLRGANPDRAGRLERELAAFLEGRVRPGQEKVQVDLDQETLDQLQTLGYVE